MLHSPAALQLAAWLCTLLVEAAGMALLTPPSARRRAVAWALGVNLVTHPLFWLGHTRLLAGTGQAGLVGAEATVVLVEGVCYVAGLRWSWRRGFGVSLLLNLASYSVGLLLWTQIATTTFIAAG